MLLLRESRLGIHDHRPLFLLNDCTLSSLGGRFLSSCLPFVARGDSVLVVVGGELLVVTDLEEDAAAGRGDCARGLPLGLLTTRRGDDGTAFCFRLRAEFGGCVTKCCIVLAERREETSLLAPLLADAQEL